MKILYSTVIDMTEHSSPRQHVNNVIRNWEKQGHSICLLHPGNTIGKQYKEGEISNKVLLVFERYKKDWKFGQALANEIRQRSYDIVYHRFASSSIFPLIRSKFLPVSMILEINADLDADLRGYWGSSVFMRTLIKFLAYTQYLIADHIIVVSEGIRNKIIRRFPKLQKNITVVPNGADLDVFQPLDHIQCRSKLGLDGDQHILSFTGNFHPYQGVGTIIQAAKQLLDHKFPFTVILVGEGAEETNLKDLVLEYRLTSNVIFTGWSDPDKTALYVGASDLCLAPYTREVMIEPNQSQTYNAMMKGSPLKIYTYMAAGRPVIASHFKEAGVFVEERGAGIAVEPENPSMFAQEITNLLSDKERLIKMGNNARLAAETELGWDTVAERIADICTHVIEAAESNR